MPDHHQLAHAVRALAMDAVQKANSGHPGMPMGMADIAVVLWNEFLRHNPSNPHWPNRDRFILSNGHGSMLLYALLHLTGYDLSLDDLKKFRQLHSKTPGHPEYGLTPGVETTTGPLGQGLANAVGMALAERTLGAQFNRPRLPLIDHYTYAFVGDGCLMEGISHEACSFAGTQRLGKLIVFWDNNGISIDGKVEGWFTEDVPARFKAYHWHVIDSVDGHNPQAIHRAIVLAREHSNQPSLICCKTTIGYGSPNLAGTAKCHGAALGNEEIELTRRNLHWPHAPFEIPSTIYHDWDHKLHGEALEKRWQALFNDYQESFPEDAKEFLRRLQRQLPSNWQDIKNTLLEQTQQQREKLATRKASQNCLEYFTGYLPELLGGSADLTESNCTHTTQATALIPSQTDGNYIYYGVREFAMVAMMNGISLYRGFIPYGGTFLVFSDYARNAIRMAALMQQRCIFVLTHDSIGLGEDGPTHQPIEHLAMLRLTPNLTVWRPCDTVETAVSWSMALAADGPSCLALSRQALPCLDRSHEQLEAIAKGGYTLTCSGDTPDCVIIATGSEVTLALEVADKLKQQGKQARVVSMPSTTVFDQQAASYRDTVLPPTLTKRIAIEAASSDYWRKYVGLEGLIFGMTRFGESAPSNALFAEFGFSADAIVGAIGKRYF